MTERVQLVNIRTGEIVWEGNDYIEAHTYRRDALIPKLSNPSKCPYHIVYPDDPDYLAAQARFAEFCACSEQRIADLPRKPVQDALFGLAEFLGGVA